MVTRGEVEVGDVDAGLDQLGVGGERGHLVGDHRAPSITSSTVMPSSCASSRASWPLRGDRPLRTAFRWPLAMSKRSASSTWLMPRETIFALRSLRGRLPFFIFAGARH